MNSSKNVVVLPVSLISRFIICSYIIQNFYDTFRQSMIDLMQGNITQRYELQFDETLKVLATIAESPFEISDFYHYGALNNELQLTESIIKSTRWPKQVNLVLKNTNQATMVES